MNAADHGSRGRKLAMPAPRRAWVHEFFVGNVDALDRRLHEAAVAWRADHDKKIFDSTLPADFDPEDHDPTRGVRIGEAKKPGPPRAPRHGDKAPRVAGRNPGARATVDLRIRAQGAGSRPADLEQLRVRFGVWLASKGLPDLEALSTDPVRLDGILADYGQCLWSSDESQGTFAETLNAVRHKYNHLQYQLKGAWSVRTAWQHLEPGTSRAPVPPVLLCALVAACLLWGGPWIEFAVCIALCFEGALRPGELLTLARVDVRFPSESGSADGSVYVILRHTKTSQTRGARWQHVRI